MLTIDNRMLLYIYLIYIFK